MQIFRTQGNNMIENLKTIVLTLSIMFLLSVGSTAEANRSLADLISEIDQSDVEYKSDIDLDSIFVYEPDVDLNDIIDLRSTGADKNKSTAQPISTLSSMTMSAGLTFVGTVRLGNDDGYCIGPNPGGAIGAPGCIPFAIQNLEVYLRGDNLYEICEAGSVSNLPNTGSQVVGNCISNGLFTTTAITNLNGTLRSPTSSGPYIWTPLPGGKGSIGSAFNSASTLTRFGSTSVGLSNFAGSASQIWTPLPPGI